MPCLALRAATVPSISSANDLYQTGAKDLTLRGADGPAPPVEACRRAVLALDQVAYPRSGDPYWSPARARQEGGNGKGVKRCQSS